MRKARALRFKPDAPAWLAAFCGAALFLLIYGPSTLNPCYDSWIYAGYIGVDVLQHQAAWQAFRFGDWAFPLTLTGNLHWPAGAAAALGDCVPLLAVPLKLISGLLPRHFQFFGWFSLLCMALGGYAGAKLLGQFGLGAAPRVLASTLFAAAPVLLERAFQHSALAAQFVVVLALYFYFLARRRWQLADGQPWQPAGAGGHTGPENGGLSVLWRFVPLAGAAVAIHVYFVPMVLAIAFAAAVDAFLAAPGKKRAARVLAPLGAAVLCALACGFLLGYFLPSSYIPGGYGSFGANLNTFWNPASYNWAMWAPGYQNLHWSRVLPMLPVVGDSLGSFNYLGLGVLLGLGAGGAAALVRLLGRRGPKGALGAALAFAKSHVGLAFSCLCLGLFAVSNVVTANSRTLFTLPLPAFVIRLADTFRSSGRLLWPLYYLLVLLCVLGLAALLPKGGRAGAKALPLALGALLLVQGFDLSGVLAEKHAYFANPVIPQSYADPENWDRIAQEGRVLYQLELNEDRTTALRAAEAGMASNFFLLARGSSAQLEGQMAEARDALLAGRLPWRIDTAFITSDAALANELQQSLAGRCERFTFERYTVFIPD